MFNSQLTLIKFHYKSMNKKITYGIGGIFFLVLLIIVSSSSSEPKVSEENKNVGATDTAKTESVITETKTPEVKTPQKVSTSTAQDGYKYYSITEVVDGDTVKVNMDGTVTTLRLIGLDTPETVDPRKPVQCFGKEASNKAKELLTGKKVRLEKDSSQDGIDKYGRTLAYIYREDGLFYNKYMIEQGYAHEYTYNTPYKYQAEFKAAQKLAQDNLRGLWSPNTCNGDTTSSSSTSTSTTTTTTPPPATQLTGKYYTSSASNTKYYAPESCEYWKTWSTSNLRSFNSLAELQKVYPSRTLSPQCN
jgi:endonuclease YncB( thermonuclease family)